jgi:hypothetical protein
MKAGSGPPDTACVVHHKTGELSTQQAKYYQGNGLKRKSLGYLFSDLIYSSADKSLALPGKKQSTAIEDFEFHISHL